MKHILSIVLCIFLFTNTTAQTYNSFYGSVVGNISSSNILNDLTAFENLGVKEIGTTALSNTQAWIKARYESLGYTNIVEQPFSYSGSTTNNIIVTKTGTLYPNTYVIIDAHYDTINGTGTNDNGSGTVLLLEIARLLKSVDTEYSIKLIHFSGEEDGLIGSNYYVNNTVIPENLDIRLVLNIDQVGGVNGMTNDTIICEEDQSNPPSNNSASSTKTLELANCIGLYSNLNTEISNAYASDYIPFENNGEIITGLYEKNETPYGHTANDLLANMDPNYLHQVTKGTLGATLHFAISTEALGIEDSTINTIKLFPNPTTNGQITIELPKSNNSNTTKFTLVDILGKQVYVQTLTQPSTTLQLNNLSKGVYLGIFENDSNRMVRKIVIN